MTSTVNRLYDHYQDAAGAVTALKQAGLSDQDISLMTRSGTDPSQTDVDRSDVTETDGNSGSAAGTGAGVGGVVGAGAGLLAGLGMLAIPGIGPVVAAGWLAATAAGAASGAIAGGAAGGLIGALTNNGMSEDDAHVYAESLKRGGTLLTVRIPQGRDSEVASILNRYPGVDTAARRGEYRSGGWQRFDAQTDSVPPARPVSTPQRAGTEV